MGTVEAFREAIAAVFASWERFFRLPEWRRAVGVLDREHDRYTLQIVECPEGKYEAQLLAYLEIRDGKIWILTDTTEEGIAPELVAQGVPKDRIVLGYYTPELREAGDFAVA